MEKARVREIPQRLVDFHTQIVLYCKIFIAQDFLSSPFSFLLSQEFKTRRETICKPIEENEREQTEKRKTKQE